MANDFSGDSSCKALWRFESGALTTDSKSTNTLTNNGGTEETTNHMEGACAVALASASQQYLNIPDANLVSGFPLKGDDAVKVGTFALYFRAATVPGSGAYACLLGKWDTPNSKNSFGIHLTNSKLRIYWGYGTGTSSEYLDTATIAANTKYHVVVTFDGVNKICYVWVYNVSTGVLTSYSKTFTNVLRVCDCDLLIGADAGATPSYFNGVIDEVVPLNRMVNEIEAVKLRSGTYSGESQLDALAVYAVVDYQEESEAKVSQVLATVEWVPTDPNTHLYSGSIGIAITPQGTCDPVWEKAGSVPIGIAPQGLYFYEAPGEFQYYGSIPVAITPDSDYVRGFAFRSSGVGVAIAPQAEYLFPDHFYESPGIELTITPEGAYRTPVAGFDNDSGYGAVDLSFLDGPPPFYVAMGNIAIGVSPLAASISLYAESLHTTSGGVAAGGELGFDFSVPNETILTTDLRVKVGGSLGITYEEPGVSYCITEGGVEVGGGCSFLFVSVEPPITHITTSRGIKVSGALGFEFIGTEELVTLITLDGGVVVGGIRRPPVLFVTPSATDETVTTLETRGTIFAGGSLEIDIPDPGVYAFELTRARVVVGGACTFGFWEPPVLELELSGGVIVEGEAIADEPARFETWVLNGFYFEPSLYGRFSFNSYAIKGDQHYAAGEDGIYLLEGEDDAGRPIHPGVRIGPTNFGFNNRKRLRAIYPGKIGSPTMRMLGKAGAESFCKLDDRDRFSVSQKVQDEIVTVEISDFDELAQITFVPVILNKR